MRFFGAPKPDRGTVALLDFGAAEYEAIVACDREFLARVFKSTAAVSYPSVPRCDVLFLYPSLNDDGSVVGSSKSLRDIIRKSGARIAIIASPHSAEQYKPLLLARPKTKVNLVATLDRKGERFPEFFEQLFALMKDGMDMPGAWVRLSPQTTRNPEAAHLPDTVFACELGATRL